MESDLVADLSADLDEFVRDVFQYLIFDSQREWAGTYLRGLMMTGLKRKSVQPMAAALGVPEQNLGHFVGVAGWEARQVAVWLAARAIRVVDPQVWVLDDHPFLRSGAKIVCAQKQYAGNGLPRLCQVGVCWHAVSPRGSTPLYWRLFMPEAWADDPQRRRAAHIPQGLSHQTKPELALEALDDLASVGLRPPVAVADSLYGQNVSFRQGLSDRGVPWLVAIPGHTALLSATGEPVTAWARESEQENAYTVAGRIRCHARRFRYRKPAHGHKARYGWFAAVRVHAAGTATRRAAAAGRDGGHLSEYTLLVQWRTKHPTDPDHADAYRIWLTDLPPDTPLSALVRYTTSRWEIETDYKDMNQNLGLGQYEGRTWPGFHHHTILVAAAHLYCLEQRLNPKAPATA
jgi:SRSO17 transposase